VFLFFNENHLRDETFIVIHLLIEYFRIVPIELVPKIQSVVRDNRILCTVPSDENYNCEYDSYCTR